MRSGDRGASAVDAMGHELPFKRSHSMSAPDWVLSLGFSV